MRPVFAYLDPVTGGALLQVLLAAAAVVGLGYQYIRRFFKSVVARFSAKPVEEEKAPSTPVS